MDCEIEFMPVGDGARAGDAIVLRYGNVGAYELMIVDGGTIDSGKLLVEHIRAEFGYNAVISHVVVTHADADHVSGIREVLDNLTVQNLWIHAPWASARSALPYFKDKRWTEDGLVKALVKEYDLIADIVATAGNKGTVLRFPFAGSRIGPFVVLSPAQRVYDLLLPQFDRTPDADQAAIEAAGLWLGKAPARGALSAFLEMAAEKLQRWFTESWTNERLKDGGQTSASNESSVVLYGDFSPDGRVLLTGDAGILALTLSAMSAEQLGLPLQQFTFVQIPHHGSRRNVGPTILNRLLGPIQPEGAPPRLAAFVSAPKDDTTHPRQMVLNAFMRRGARVVATQGVKKVHWGGFPTRAGYSAAAPMPFVSRVEDYQ
jgi:beta-lactamase superfamily II metal-dependent hydrolase